jgi:hypothetical protein
MFPKKNLAKLVEFKLGKQKFRNFSQSFWSNNKEGYFYPFPFLKETFISPLFAKVG